VKTVCRNVKRCRAGDHIERWAGSGLLVAERQFVKSRAIGRFRERSRRCTPVSPPGSRGPGVVVARRSAKTQNGLALVRAREVGVETRTKIVNVGRGIVKSSGHRLPTSAASSFARKAKRACPGVLQPTLLPLLRVVENLTREVELYDKLVAQAGRPFRKFPPVRVRAIFVSSLLNTSYHASPISG